jgi:hypothetical protein
MAADSSRGDEMHESLASFQRAQELGDATERRHVLLRRWDGRRDRIVAEIESNRRGEYTVPTWVLALVLAALVGGIVAFIVFG